VSQWQTMSECARRPTVSRTSASRIVRHWPVYCTRRLNDATPVKTDRRANRLIATSSSSRSSSSYIGIASSSYVSTGRSGSSSDSSNAAHATNARKYATDAWRKRRSGQNGKFCCVVATLCALRQGACTQRRKFEPNGTDQ